MGLPRLRGTMSYNDMEVFYKIGLELEESELDTLIAAVWNAQKNAAPEAYKQLSDLRQLMERARTYPRIAHIKMSPDKTIVVQQ